MSRPIGYRAALEWIASNDDTEWLEDTGGCLSVTAALVADIYGKSDAQVINDLRVACNRLRIKRAEEICRGEL